MLCICILFYFLIMVCGGFIKLFFVKNALNGYPLFLYFREEKKN